VWLRVLPHGIADRGTFIGNQPLSIVAVNVESGKELHALAAPNTVLQVYVVTMTFTEGGTWKWSATDGGYVVATPLPAIFVDPGDGSSAGDAARSSASTIVKISVSDGSFVLPSTPIHVGDTIEWTNVGSLSHIVMSNDRGFEDVPLLQPGDTYRTTASAAGTFAIFCTPHQGMVAKVVIEA
jgi:plastocyanin